MPGPRADFVCFRCEEAEPGSGGPFRDLPISPKPSCPRCRARRWMTRQWSGYAQAVTTGMVQRAENLVGPITDGHRNSQRRASPFATRAVPLNGMGAAMSELAGRPMNVQMPNGEAAVRGHAWGGAQPLVPDVRVRGPRENTLVVGRDT